MCAMQDKGVDGIKQTCPNCGQSKTVTLVKPAEEHPRKHYCTECNHEWWEFDKHGFLSADPDEV
jgi:ssDNA-binding Zn-finger/Zn-ribbon topoisomerase 1